MTTVSQNPTIMREMQKLSNRVYELERRVRVKQKNLKPPVLQFGAVVPEVVAGLSPNNGTGIAVARAKHTHGTPPLQSLAHSHPNYIEEDPLNPDKVSIFAMPAPIWDTSNGTVPISAMPPTLWNAPAGAIQVATLPAAIWDKNAAKIPVGAMPLQIWDPNLGRIPVNSLDPAIWSVSLAKIPVSALPSDVQLVGQKGLSFGYAPLGGDARVPANNMNPVIDVPGGTVIDFKIGGVSIACVHNAELRALQLRSLGYQDGSYSGSGVKSEGNASPYAGFGAHVIGSGAAQFRLRFGNGETWEAVGNSGGAYVAIDAASFNVGSSERIKQDIRSLDTELSRVLQLRPVRFRRPVVTTYPTPNVLRSEDTDFLGLIAEEVAELYPEVCTWDMEMKPKTIDYGALVAPLIMAVQELHKMIERRP